MPTPEARHIDRYILGEVLGRGGMGTVYRAWDTLLNREVAMKVLSAGASYDASRLNELLAEARLAASLQHDNIVDIYDVSRDGPPFYIVSELAQGFVLTEWLEPRQPLATELAGHVVRRLASALDHAHERGIVHRDVKPGNIVLHRDGRVKLLDFGVALFIGSEDPRHRGGIVGTPAYMSPEQIRQLPLTPATDTYNLALVAYEMLTGRPAFTGASDAEILERQATAFPVSPLVLNGSLPLEVAPLLSWALAKNPAERPEETGAFARELSAVLKSSTAKLGPQTASGRLESPLLPPRPPRGLGLVTTVLGIALAVAVLLGILALSMLMSGESLVDDGRPRGATALAAAATDPPAAATMVATLAATQPPATTSVVPAATEPVRVAAPIPPTAALPQAATVAAPAAVVAERCAAGLTPPQLLGPEPDADCSAGCTFRWQWDQALQADEYFQVQFRPNGTGALRGLHRPTRDAETSVGTRSDRVFSDVCSDECQGKWSVTVVHWDGADPSSIGCVVTRSEWRPGKL